MNKPFDIGFIGIGIMGAPSVRRLRQRAGGDGTGLNRERFAEVEASGAKWADTSRGSCRVGCDNHLRAWRPRHRKRLFRAEWTTAGQGANIVIDLSTTSPQMTATLIERTNFQWLDCPVSGGPGAAELRDINNDGWRQ